MDIVTSTSVNSYIYTGGFLRPGTDKGCHLESKEIVSFCRTQKRVLKKFSRGHQKKKVPCWLVLFILINNHSYLKCKSRNGQHILAELQNNLGMES